MSWWRRGTNEPRRGFSLPASPERVDDELQEEFRFHIEERRAELIAGGMTAAEADAEVARRFGNPERYRQLARSIDLDGLRRQRRSDFWSTLWRETRRSARVLARERAFSFLTFATLALGIGATTAMFSVLDAVVLRPLPYDAPGELVSVLHPATVPGSGERRWGVSPGGWVHFRRDSRTLESFGIYRSFGETVTNGGEAATAQFALVSQGVLEALRARAALGRLLDVRDDTPGAPRVAVISHEFHQRRFGGDPGIIGRPLETSDGSYEIVGVTTPGLALPLPGPFADASDLSGFRADAWITMQVDQAGPFWNNHPNVGVGRLRPGVTVAEANAEFSALLARFPEQMPNAYTPRFIEQYGFRVEVRPLRESVLGDTLPRVLWMLFASVLLVLLIAAANVGNLFLVRMEARRREAAVRTALGADRTHMAAHYLSESLVLCTTAALAAVALAHGTLRLILAIAPPSVPRLATVSVTPLAALLAIGIGVALGIVLGVAPLFRRELDVETLRDGSRGLSASPRQRLVRGALVVGQVALTLVLLAAATLMLRSFDQLRRVQPGFDPSHTLTFSLSLPFTRYDTREKALVLHRALQERIRGLPGVVAVGAGGGATPFVDFGTGCSVVFRQNLPYDVGEQTPCVSTPTAIPGYFETLGMEVRGRVPTWADVEQRTGAVVVTRALADRLWPGDDPIGKGIATNGQDSDVWYHVVGVIPELRVEALDQPPTEGVFYAATGLRPNQRSGALNDLTLFVRTSGSDPLALVAPIRAMVQELDPLVPLEDARTMAAVVARSMSRVTFSLVLLGIAGVMGLLLSAVGLYGVVSYVVAQRRAEIGIRMALGASARAVLGLVLVQSMRLAAVGVALGIVGAVVAGRLLRVTLFGVSANDPVVLGGVACFLLGIVLLASWAPARRAARIDPTEAMR